MATVTYYLKNLKGNDAAIMLRFTIDRNSRFKLATGERVNPQNWDTKNQRAKSRWAGAAALNQILDRIRVDMIQLYRDCKTLRLDDLKEKARNLTKRGTAEVTPDVLLSTVLDEFIALAEQEKDDKTAKMYRSLRADLNKFNPKLTISGTDNRFYDDWKAHHYKKGRIDSTAFKYFSNLCAFLSWADSRGYEVHQTNNKPTHKSWKHPKRVNDPITLTLAEIEKLEALDITEELIMEKLPPAKHGRREGKTAKAFIIARDAFILECRTGQRISDLMKFDLRDVTDGWWTNPVAKGRRIHAKKTRIPFTTSFTGKAWMILQKYGFKMPKISEQKINKNIKLVCRLAGIDQEVRRGYWKQNKYLVEVGPKSDFITTHIARKTFITLALQYMKPKLVKDIAGVSWNTLRHYEGVTEDERLIEGLNSIPATNIMKIA